MAEATGVSYVHDAAKLARVAASQAGPGTRVVLAERARGDRRLAAKGFEVVRELELREWGQPPQFPFYRISSFVADEEGNIFIALWSEGTIVKFDSSGRYLCSFGRKGRGPGELLTPGGMNLAPDGKLWVLDAGNSRLTAFTRDGVYLRSIPLKGSASPAGFAISDSAFFLSFWDRESERVIHKFDMSGRPVSSFGEGATFSGPSTPWRDAVRTIICQGRLLMFRGELYYSQLNPYEIRKYGPEGDLRLRLFRKSEFMTPMQVRLSGREGATLRLPPVSHFIGVWQDRILNEVFIPDYSSSGRPTYVVDLFDLDGSLLASFTLPRGLSVGYVDARGKMYGVYTDEERSEAVVRFRLVARP